LNFSRYVLLQFWHLYPALVSIYNLFAHYIILKNGFNFSTMIKMTFSSHSKYKGVAPLVDNLPRTSPIKNQIISIPFMQNVDRNRFSLNLPPASDCGSCNGAK